jgi:hypothetical protein
VSPRWRPVAWALAVDTAALWVWAAFAPRPLEAIGLEHLTNPLGLQQAEAAFTLLIGIAFPIGALLAVLSVALMVVRFRRAWGMERQQLKWFTYAATLVTLLWLVFFAAGLDRLLPPVLFLIASDIWLAGIPAAIGIAVLRYRLYDIDRIINRTLVYGLLTAVLGLGYAGAVLLLGQLFGGVTNDPPSQGSGVLACCPFHPRVMPRVAQGRRGSRACWQRPAAGADRPGAADRPSRPWPARGDLVATRWEPAVW